METPESLLNEQQLRLHIPISRRELGRWVTEGCPSIKKGRRRFYRLKAIYRWMKAKGYFEGDWIGEE